MRSLKLPLALLVSSALAAAAAAPALSQPKVAADDVPAGVVAAVKAAEPGFTIVEAELKERDGRRYYDVEGTRADGSELEFDLLETGASWTVVEIQRDIDWSTAPAPVRQAAGDVKPVRVIESRQASDGTVIYELFAEGKPVEPSLEVRWKDGKADLLSERWPH